jgi:hypothetical protein
MAYITPKWQPSSTTLGDGVGNGTQLFANTGAGFQVAFDAASDDEFLFNLPLRDHQGVAYNGQDIALEICWALFSTAPSASDDVVWDIDYAFVKDDGTENPYTLVDGNLTDTIVVDARTADRKYRDTLSTMTGKVGATGLQVTLRRNSTGAGADSYSGTVDLYEVNFKLA